MDLAEADHNHGIHGTHGRERLPEILVQEEMGLSYKGRLLTGCLRVVFYGLLATRANRLTHDEVKSEGNLRKPCRLEARLSCLLFRRLSCR